MHSGVMEGTQDATLSLHMVLSVISLASSLDTNLASLQVDLSRPTTPGHRSESNLRKRMQQDRRGTNFDSELLRVFSTLLTQRASKFNPTTSISTVFIPLIKCT